MSGIEMKRPSLVLTAALICGCATPYQPYDGADAGEGFSETQLEPNTYEVMFHANAATSRRRADDFVLLRAAELCLLNGFRYLVVTSTSQDMPTLARRPQVGWDRTTNSTANILGIERIEGASTTTMRGAPRPSYTKPRPSIVVEFLKQEPEEPAEDSRPIYDAETVSNSIRTEYKMTRDVP